MEIYEPRCSPQRIEILHFPTASLYLERATNITMRLVVIVASILKSIYMNSILSRFQLRNSGRHSQHNSDKRLSHCLTTAL